MTDQPNEVVSVDTDDLDAFNDMLLGKTKPEVVEETPVVDNEPDPVVETDIDEDVTDEPKEEPDGEDPKPEEKPKKVNRFQERINELTAKAKEAERATEELQRKLREYEAKQAAPEQKTSLEIKDASLPGPDDKNQDGSDKYPLGEFDPSYIRDLNRAIIEEERKSFREQEEKERQARQNQEARDEIQNQWVEKLAPVAEQHEDFIDKTMLLETTFSDLDSNYADYIVQTIKSLDHGPEVLYYFANNLEEADRLLKGGPLVATLALGEINSMFKGQGRKETKVSKAPPPPQVSTKGTSARVAFTADTDDLDAFSDAFFPKKKK